VQKQSAPQHLDRRGLRVAEEVRVDLLDDVGADVAKVPFVLDRDQGALGAVARLVAKARDDAAFELRDLGPLPGSVVGEVYEVDEATLATPEQVEGRPAIVLRNWRSRRMEKAA